MNIFFGKISSVFNTEQIDKGFYQAPRGSSWFNGIDIDDYAFVIGGGKIQLWQAKEWKNIEGDDLLDFKVLKKDLGIAVRDLVEFKYFKLTKDLVVKTTRSTGGEKKAFFPIEYSTDFTEEMLLTNETSLYEENQRSIFFHSNSNLLKVDSYDIQFYFENGELFFKEPSFSDPDIANDFIDNIPNIGKGQKNKDITLATIKASSNHNRNIRNELTFLRIYDALFCKYKIADNKTRYWVVNGNDDEHIEYDIENSIFVMQYQYGVQRNNKVSTLLNRCNEMKPGDRVLLINQNYYYASAILSDINLYDGFKKTLETTLHKQIREKICNHAPDIVGYTDAPCYYEDFSEDNDFNGKWGQRLVVEEWENVNREGIYIPGVKSYSDQTRDAIYELEGDIFFNKVNAILAGNESISAKLNEESNVKEINMNKIPLPKNTILFGPPGTGKTYTTIQKAVELCRVEVTDRNNRAEIKDHFETLVKQGRIIFTTFHQSMTYEDFVEGIKPQEPAKEGDPLIYRIDKGIFSMMVTRALYSIYQKNEQAQSKEILDFSSIYDSYLDELEEKLGVEKEIPLTLKSGGKILVEGISDQRNIVLRHPSGNRSYTVSKSRLAKLHKGIENLDKLNNISEQIRDVIGGCNASAYWVILKEVRKRLNTQTVPRKSEYISQPTLEEMEQINDTFEGKSLRGMEGEPHVLIIDEINRGNISEIFGELITLLEDDKRLGEDEELKVTLPYSKKEFGVPNNLYILGTMNTADRSVEALDTALRRRFSFEEIAPDTSIITEMVGDDGIIEDFDISEILEVINKRIEKLLSHDHLIGHSYFLNVKNLADLQWVFMNKIIPLLKEYFYGDLGKIGLVIGEGFFDMNQEDYSDDFFASFSDYDTSDLVDRSIYHIKKNMKHQEFEGALNSLLNRNE